MASLVAALTPALQSRAAPAAAPRGVVCSAAPNRRAVLGAGAASVAGVALASQPLAATAADPKPEAPAGPISSSLIDEETAKKIESGEIPRQKGPNGIEFVDVVVGTGASPATGFQVVANYVAMSPAGRAFDDSVAKRQLYDFRIGSGTVIDGLDQGIRTMKSGGIRRLYVPGELGFPKGIPAAAGRPRLPPLSPTIWDVQLLIVPGLDDE